MNTFVTHESDGDKQVAEKQQGVKNIHTEKEKKKDKTKTAPKNPVEQDTFSEIRIDYEMETESEQRTDEEQQDRSLLPTKI